MFIILILFIVLGSIIIIHLLFPAFLLLISSLFRIKSKKNANPDTNGAGDYAVIVTAYEDLSLIHAVVDSILKVDYGNFIIYIVADNCDVSTLNFADERIVVLRPTEVLSSNVKSHFYAINNFKRQHDRITIIDSDNLVQSSYFVELNHIFDLGYHAVQGVREAKNLNTSLACLDAANDIYYRYADKELLTLAGSSASLSGSGMAFSTELYKECMLKLDASGAGFDKILQYEIVIRKLKIAFAKKAIVYDEKTSKSDQLVKQRARWINTWFKFFKLGLKMMLSGVVNRDWNQFLFSIMLVRPPLFILLFLSLLWFAIGLLIVPELSLIIVISSFIFVFTFMKSLSHFKADRRIYQSLKRIPIFIFFQVQALLKAKKANKLSVATKHDHNTTINDLD